MGQNALKIKWRVQPDATCTTAVQLKMFSAEFNRLLVDIRDPVGFRSTPPFYDLKAPSHFTHSNQWDASQQVSWTEFSDFFKSDPYPHPKHMNNIQPKEAPRNALVQLPISP